MASYSQSTSTPTVPYADLSRSLDDAFQFTSSSSSSLPKTHSSALPVDISSTSPPSFDSTIRGGLITQHRSSTSVNSNPATPSKAAVNSLLDLEAFLDDETPVTLNNIPMRHSSSSLLKAKPRTPTSAPPSPATNQLQQQPDGKFVYTLSPSDTVEGLSLRFGVKTADLKKANRLFNARDLCVRKSCIIPLTAEQYQQYQTDLGTLTRREEAHRQEVLTLFLEKTSASAEVAQVYLEDSHYHLGRALDRYNLENMTTTEPLDIRQTSRPTFTIARSSEREQSISAKISQTHQDTLDDLFDL